MTFAISKELQFFAGHRFYVNLTPMAGKPALIIPFMSLSESNNQSKILKLSSNLALSLYFLTVTKIYNQKLKTKAPKGFQR
jgi:hypothetical protein